MPALHKQYVADCPFIVPAELALPSGPTPYRYGGSFLFDAVQSLRQEEKAIGNPRDELRMYLESGVEETSDVVEYWGVSVSTDAALGVYIIESLQSLDRNNQTQSTLL